MPVELGSVAHIFAVTGANCGLGRALVNAASKRAPPTEKRHIILIGRDSTQLQAVKDKVIKGANVLVHVASGVDLRDPASETVDKIMKKISEVVALVSESRLRLTLVQCAGSMGDVSKSICDYAEGEISEYAHINYVAFALLTGAFLSYAKSLSAADQITMVNISSLFAVAPFPNWGLYASVKAARDQFVRVAVAENKGDQRVRMLSYAPGALDTNMQAVARKSIADEEQKQFLAHAHESKGLISADASAALMCGLLETGEFENGAHVDISEIMS